MSDTLTAQCAQPPLQKTESVKADLTEKQSPPAPDSTSEHKQPSAQTEDSEIEEDEAFLDGSADQSDTTDDLPEGFIPRGSPSKPVAARPRPKPK